MTVKFIADIGSNHNQSMARIADLVAAAKDCGCRAAKVQLFSAGRLYAQPFRNLVESARQAELPADWLPDIANLCHRNDLEFHVTPFDMHSLELARRHADALKIASYSILDRQLIEATAVCGKPMAISTGLALMDEINDAYTTARMFNHRVELYHCAAVYPAKPGVCDLRVIETLRRKFGSCGWSDHTREPAVIHYAVALGATAVEFHLDLPDCAGAESKHGHCWTPAEIAAVIDQTAVGLPALGQPKDADYLFEARKWRNDPDDEARPLRKFRDELLGK